MKKLLILVFLFLLPALVFAEEFAREWTTISGKKLTAVWDSDSDVGEGQIRLRSGNQFFRIRVDQLSASDQAYVKERLSSRTSPATRGEFSGESIGDDSSLVAKSRRYALLIGVNTYTPPISSLEYCGNDMMYLADTFEEIGFLRENITLMTDESSSHFRPTLANIEHQISLICQMMEPEDMLIIAFSGHGVMVDEKAYLCPGDANIDNVDTLISREWVYEQLENSRASQKLMIVDACRNQITIPGSRALGEVRPLDNPAGSKDHGFVLLASCQPNQVSWEMSQLKHGVFTYFLAEGLRGGAENSDGFVSILSLADYATQKTETFVKKHQDKVQVPMVKVPGEMTNFSLTATDSLSTRKVERVNGVRYAFRWCPAGEGIIGSPENEEGRDSTEELYMELIQGFWMLETEVTQEMWESIMKDNPSEFKGKRNPVENVSGDDCRIFCRQLSRKLGLSVRLPTEAEWEYACRAGTTGPYAGPLSSMGWYCENSGGKTHPVRQKQANAWGLYDMHGNVNEFCLEKGYRFSVTCCGGDWMSPSQYCRSAKRRNSGASSRVGFRIVLIDSDNLNSD